MTVWLRITNQDASQEVHYAGWSPGDNSGLEDIATCQDLMHSPVGQLSNFEGMKFVGQKRNIVIPAHQSIDDVLVFQTPNSGTRYLFITLPGPAVGMEGTGELVLTPSMYNEDLKTGPSKK